MPSLASGVTFAIFNSIAFGVSSQIVDGALADAVDRNVKCHSMADALAFVVVAQSRRNVSPLAIVSVLFCSGGISFGFCAPIASMLLGRTCKNGVYIRRAFAEYVLMAMHLNFLLSVSMLAFVISRLPLVN